MSGGISTMDEKAGDAGNGQICWACNGVGFIPGSNRCTTCNGIGRLQPASTESFERFGNKLANVPGHIYKDDAEGNRRRS